VRAIRNLRAEKNLPPSKKLPALIVGGERTGMLKEQAAILTSLAGLDPAALTITEKAGEKPEGAVSLVVGAVEIHLTLAGAVDAAAERQRLEKELAEADSQISRLEKLLGGDFAGKAPAQVVAREREKLAAYRQTADKIRAQLQES
jgi:valyl-tRNA synthetase